MSLDTVPPVTKSFIENAGVRACLRSCPRGILWAAPHKDADLLTCKVIGMNKLRSNIPSTGDRSADMPDDVFIFFRGRHAPGKQYSPVMHRPQAGGGA